MHALQEGVAVSRLYGCILLRTTTPYVRSIPRYTGISPENDIGGCVRSTAYAYSSRNETHEQIRKNTEHLLSLFMPSRGRRTQLKIDNMEDERNSCTP